MSDTVSLEERPLPAWSAIAEAGGIDAWLVLELKARNLWSDGAPATLTDAERQRYKAEREEERRVRKHLRRHAWKAFRAAHLVHLGAGVFYHDTVDVDRFDIDDPEARRQANELPPLRSAQDLARALDLSIPHLRWLAFHRDVDDQSHYRRWLIPKRDGNHRLISAPKPKLKAAQQWIHRNIAERLPVHGDAHGFLPGRSTVTNARVHAGAAIVIKFDLQDFYPTITLPRIKGLFRKAGYGEQVATVLALLCTEAPRDPILLDGKTLYIACGPRSLPQGAPTSPTLTNALCLRLDLRLSALALHLGARYTRYADDLTFSFPGAADSPKLGRLRSGVARIVTAEGFRLHRTKTRIMRAGRSQRVTGLVVNATAPGRPDVRVPRTIRRRLRAALHNREHGRAHGDLDQLHGLAAYIHMSDPALGQTFLEQVALLRNRGDERS